MNPSEHECAYCGKPATQFLFAQYICDSEECVNKARDDRGGPGGHLFLKESHEGQNVMEPDFDEDLD